MWVVLACALVGQTAVDPHVRSLTTYALPKEKRSDFVKALNGHVNGMSRELEIKGVQVKGDIVTLDLRDYGWTPELWDSLLRVYPWVDQQLVQVQVVKWWPAGKPWLDGKVYQKPFQYWAWENKTAAAYDAPIRADWFLAQTVIAEGKKPGYYDFLGVKDQKTFEALIRFDGKLGKALEQRRVVLVSGISLQPRRVQRDATVLGGYWRTFDNEVAKDNADPANALDDAFTFKATEAIAPLPNGMAAYGLWDDKGVLQNKAPDNIVGGDRTSASNDTRLHINLSCIRCHYQGKDESGLKGIAELKISKLASYDYAKFQELRRQYLDAVKELKPLMAQDRAGYERAIKLATGWDGNTYAKKLQEFYAWYEDAKIDLKRAAYEVGVTEAKFVAALGSYEQKAYLLPTLTVLTGGGVINQRQWEQAFPIAVQIVKGSK